MPPLPDHPSFLAGLGQLYRALWAHAAGDHWRVVLFMAALLVAQTIKLAIPYFSAEAVNALQTAGSDGLRAAGGFLALTFATALAAWVLHGPARVLERSVALRIRTRFTEALYDRLTGLPLAWHTAHHSGDTIQISATSARALFTFSQNQFIYLQNLVSLIGPLAALMVVSAVTGTVAVAGYAAIMVALLRFDRTMIALARAENRAEGRLFASLVDCLGNITTVLTLRLQGPMRRLIGRRLAEVAEPVRRSVVVNEAKWCAIDLMNNALRCGLVALYGWTAYRHGGAVMLGTAVLVHQYAQQVGAVVGTMATQYQDLVRLQTDFGSVSTVPEAAAAEQAAPLDPDWRVLSVRDLRFAYGDAPALQDIDLTLQRGRRIALIGESGCGKSTLLRVLAGLYGRQAVRIAVDGQDRPDLGHLGAAATLIPQEPEIFEGTVGHNVTLGLDYGEAALARAVEAAALGPVLAALPGGLEAPVEERGANFSGGQRQRIALARGFLAAGRSGLILLDEPTSSLDPETEQRVYDALMAAFPDACIVSAVHRLHLLERFDTAIAMAGGRIVDSGSPAAVLERRAAAARAAAA